jgi:4-hydroxythreonine-4-phosphate dehydrogenase
MNKPIIGITMGEPAGIGPEISVKSLYNDGVREICRPFILGDTEVLEQAHEFAQGIDIKDKTVRGYQTIDEINSSGFRNDEIAVLDFNNVPLEELVHSVDTAMGGKAAGEYIEKAIHLALAQKIDGVVTAPICKVSFKMGGWGLKYPGHTEMFADLTNTKRYGMLLAHGDFRVIHATTHIPLREVPDAITYDRVIDSIKLADKSCRLFGIENPRIAVCGLNPHSGEGGKMGTEEIETIIPAIKYCQEQGMNVDGPIPSDTAWSKVVGGAYDIGVAMYHDQGHIPTKVLGFTYNTDGTFNDIQGINATIGTPVIRVSVDHGVAYGKAGKGIATPNSLIQAIEAATMLANNRKD